MIQRIQTVYLFLVACLSFVSLFATIGRYTIGGAVCASFSNFCFKSDVQGLDSAGPYALGVLLLLVIILSLTSIFLFRKRMRQLRLTILSTILLVGYVLVYCFFAWLYQGKLELACPAEHPSFTVTLLAVFPVVCIILNALAIHGIRKDEALVRSLDRIR